MNGYRVGRFILDLDRQELLCEGRPVGLTRKNFEVVRELIQAENRTVARDELARAVWPDTVVEEATLRQNIYTLRGLIRELDPEREYLETIPKVGYRMSVPVERLNGDAGNGAPPKPAPPAALRTRWIAAVAVVVLAATGLALAGRWPSRAGSSVDVGRAEELIRQGWLILDAREGERFPAAMALFNDALALNPRSATAHAGKALAYALMSNETAAMAEAARTEELDPLLGVSAAVRGFYLGLYRWQWAEAGRVLSAVNLKGCPDPFCRQWLAFHLGITGDAAASVREAAYAVEMNPSRLAPRALFGQMLYWAGDTRSALRELTTVVDAGGVATHARLHLWKVQLALGDRRSASQTLLLALEPMWYRLPPQDPFRVLASRTDLYGTPRFFHELINVGSRTGMNEYFRAEIAMAAGEPEEALSHLEASVAQHAFFAPYAKHDPLFTPLHGNPRYEAAMKRIGL